MWEWIRRRRTFTKRWTRNRLTVTNYHHFSIVPPNDHRTLAHYTHNAYQVFFRMATVCRCLFARFRIFIFHLCHFFSALFFLGYFHFGLIFFTFYDVFVFVRCRPRRLPFVRHTHCIKCVRNAQITTFSFVSRRLNYIPAGTGCFATTKNSQFVMNTH